jgi:hypothetical protein
VIDLNFNLLEGTIPSELFGLTALAQIDLNDNLLTGPVGTGVGNLRDLEFFQVQNNQLTGTIPSQFQELLSLGAYFLRNRSSFLYPLWVNAVFERAAVPNIPGKISR